MPRVGIITLRGQTDAPPSDDTTEGTVNPNEHALSAAQVEADRLHKEYLDTCNNFPRNELSFTDLNVRFRRLDRQDPCVDRTKATKTLIADIEKSMDTEREFAERYRRLLNAWEKDTVQYITELGDRLTNAATNLQNQVEVSDWRADDLLTGLLDKARRLLYDSAGAE